jgi:hypothetical protein
MTFLSEIRRRVRHAESGIGQSIRDDETILDGPFKGLRPSQLRELLRLVALHGTKAGREPRTPTPSSDALAINPDDVRDDRHEDNINVIERIEP